MPLQRYYNTIYIYTHNTATWTCSTSWYILVVHRSTSSWQNTLYAQKEKIETGLQEDSLMAMSSVHSTEKCSRVQKPQPDLSVWAIDAKSWLKFIHRFTSLHSTFRSWCPAVLSGTISLVHYLRLEGTATLATEPLQKLLVMTLVLGGPILITLRCINKLLYFEWSPPWHVGRRLSGEGCHWEYDGKNGEFENIDFRFPWLSDTSEMGFGHDVPFLNYSDRLPHPSDLCQPDRVRWG